MTERTEKDIRGILFRVYPAGNSMPEKLFKKTVRFDGTFKSRDLEKRYQEKEWCHFSRRLRIIFLLTGVAYLGGIFIDNLALGEGIAFYRLMAARTVTFLIAMISILFTLPSDGYRQIQKIIFLYFLAICFSECLELISKPELGRESIPFLLFILISYFVFFNGKMVYLVSAGLIGTLSYGFILFRLFPSDPAHISTVLMTYAFVMILSVYYTRNINRARRMEFYAVNELKESNSRLQKEIDSRKAAEEKLKTLSFTDELTGLFNRRHFSDTAEKEISRTCRSAHPLSLLFMDVDHFKKVNDNYGHDSGDAVLKELARILKSATREIDVSCRFGGEEFAVLLPETDTDAALIIAERLRRNIADRIISYKGKSLSITVSIGVSGLIKEDNLEQLLKRADQSLYEAKSNGRNRSVLNAKAV